MFLIPPANVAVPETNMTVLVSKEHEKDDRPHSTSNFGTAPRFGLREQPRRDQTTVGMQRVQFISARHARENMGN